MSLTKIDKLTPAQEEALVKFREEWLAIGPATGAADVEAIRPVINEFYRRIGKDAPVIVRVGSPMSAQVLLNLLSGGFGESLHKSLNDSIHASIHASLAPRLHKSLNDSIHASIAPSLNNRLHDSIHASLAPSLHNRLHNILRVGIADLTRGLGADLHAALSADLRNDLHADLRNIPHADLRNILHADLRGILSDGKMKYFLTWLWGSLDAYWIAFYLFAQEHIKPDIYTPEQSELLGLWATLAKNCGWWYPFDGLCVVCDRSSEMHRNERGRLHNPTGAAVVFEDGWKVYAYHGVRVPAWIIEHPDQITSEKIMAENNAEVRRVMIENMGFEAFMTQASAKVIHEDVDQQNNVRILLRADDADDEDIVAVRVIDPSTGRAYILRVPPTMRTCHDAVAWTFNMSADEYQPVVET